MIKGYDDTKGDRKRMTLKRFNPETPHVPVVMDSANTKHSATHIVAPGHMGITKSTLSRISVRTLGYGMLCLMLGMSVGVFFGLHKLDLPGALIVAICLGFVLGMLLRWRRSR